MGNASLNPAVYGPNGYVLKHLDMVEVREQPRPALTMQLRIYNWDAGAHPLCVVGSV